MGQTNSYRNLVGNLLEIGPLEDEEVVGSTTLRFILGKYEYQRLLVLAQDHIQLWALTVLNVQVLLPDSK
jgi:hypothetical protein